MARTANKKRNVNTVPKNNIPLLIGRILSTIGKPFYFLISRFIFGLLSILELTGHLVTFVFNSLLKNLTKVTRRLKTVKKFKPVFVFPDFLKIFRLERLRLDLFEIAVFSKIKRFFRKRLIIMAVVLFVAGFVLSFYFLILKDLPSPNLLSSITPQVSTKIYDRNGNLLYKIYKNENRTLVPLTQIPVHVRMATLAAEDAEFYNNPGFSVKGMLRAAIQDVQTGSLQGGSTITQQLVKNVLLSPEKTLTRKIKEIILSIEVETNYTKDQILEMYLNQVSYGGTAYGIEEASQEFFNKDVGELDLAEAAYLAGLPKSPTSYSPYGQSPELGIARQREVLKLMVINKFITNDQEKEAEVEKLIFSPPGSQIKAPHFVMYIRQILVNKYGEDMVEKGGLEVTTSLDLPTEEMAEKVVQDEVDKLKGLNVGNGSALVIDPKTGEILAMVGSKNYFDSVGGGQVNVTTRLRQPGSSIKVVNYAYALSKGGYTPASIIDDSPITYVTPGSPPYSPVNYDGQFKGNIPLRSALAQSRNIPAVKVLASYGVNNMVNEGKDLGIFSWDDSKNFGLSLTLGGGAVTALDMARVYSTLANSGKTPALLPILTVKDYKGTILENNASKNTQTLDPGVSFLLTNILSDNNARAPEFGLNSFLVIPNHPEVAVKTGTSNDLRDNWTDGYNQNYVVIVWVGNNDNSPMSRIASGVTGASPIWNKIMSALLENKSLVDWQIPDDVSKITCPDGKSEWFLKSNILPNFCNPTPIPTIDGKDNKDKVLNGASTTH